MMIKKPETHEVPKKSESALAKELKAAAAATESIIPTKDFRDRPFGKDEPEMAFRAGIPSSPVPSEFAQSMRDKGHASKKTVADHD